jgi:hypothetical protein
LEAVSRKTEALCVFHFHIDFNIAVGCFDLSMAQPHASAVHLLESGTDMRIVFGHSGRSLLSRTPHRLSVLFEKFKWRLVTRVLGLPLIAGRDAVVELYLKRRM